MTTAAPTIQFTRQELILDPAKAEAAEVHIFGCGTVGSNAANEIARLGVPKLNLYDFDDVEPHNLPSQRFDMTHLGKNKAEMVKDQLVHLTNNGGRQIKTHNRKVEGAVMLKGIAILAVDSMESRRTIWEKALRPQRDVTLALDFRMKANLLQCYAFDPRDERYEAVLFTDEDADPGPCGGRTVSYTGALSGCIAANYVRKALVGDDIPFFTGIDLDAMQLMRSGDE
jgi:sulfur carrier protein ThiS adenylyltransferase